MVDFINRVRKKKKKKKEEEKIKPRFSPVILNICTPCWITSSKPSYSCTSWSLARSLARFEIEWLIDKDLVLIQKRNTEKLWTVSESHRGFYETRYAPGLFLHGQNFRKVLNTVTDTIARPFSRARKIDMRDSPIFFSCSNRIRNVQISDKYLFFPNVL